MTLNADNTLVPTTGGAYFAPLGTTLPTDATETLNVAFLECGYLGPDGISQSIDTDVTDIKAWQNGDTVRSIQTSHDVVYKMKMIEVNDNTRALYYGDDFSDGTVEITGQQQPKRQFVFQMIDGDTDIRVVVPNGQVFERGEIVYNGEQEIGFEVSIKCFPDAEGVKAYIYQDEES